MCWDCGDYPKGDPHKNYVRGGVDPDDFYKEVDYRLAKPKPKRKKKKTRPGCRENDFGPHIYVWTSEYVTEDDSFFFAVFGWHKWEDQRCAGCGKHKESKKTERYETIKYRKYVKMYGDGSQVPRGAPVPRHRINRKPYFPSWNWEEYDERFIAAREEYLAKHQASGGWQARAHVSDSYRFVW